VLPLSWSYTCCWVPETVHLLDWYCWRAYLVVGLADLGW